MIFDWFNYNKFAVDRYSKIVMKNVFLRIVQKYKTNKPTHSVGKVSLLIKNEKSKDKHEYKSLSTKQTQFTLCIICVISSRKLRSVPL